MEKTVVVVKELGTVLAGDGKRRMRWRVACPCCGKKRDAYSKTIKAAGHSVCRSCSITEANTSHGDSKNRLHKLWRQMRNRCSNPSATRYERYGGRGIGFCQEWESYEAFRDWAVSAGYGDTKTLDRIDNDKGYSPENCRWTTKRVQARNTRKLYSHNTSGYRGVYLNKQNGTWIANISLGDKTKYLGSFSTARKAAHAYDDFVKSNNLEHTTNF